jgi:hypothetical protein
LEKDLNQRKAQRSAKKQKKLSLTSIKKKSKGEDVPAELAPPADAKKDAAAAPAKDAAAAPAKDDAAAKDAAPAAKDGEKKDDKKEDAKDGAKDEKKDDKAKDGEEKKEQTPEEKDAQEEAAQKLRDAEEAVRIARFKEIAKTKVADLIKKHEDLDKHLKEQYANLEKIL